MDTSQIKTLLIGAVGGGFLMTILGFAGLDWHLGRTVEEMTTQATEDAMVTALAPICAANFQAAAKSDASLTEKLTKTGTWQRDDHIRDGGYATFPGTEANEPVSEGCVKLLMKDQ